MNNNQKFLAWFISKIVLYLIGFILFLAIAMTTAERLYTLWFMPN